MNSEQRINPVIDHLFRHHFGKMVSVLCRIFGIEHLENIEDAIQDTFAKASVSWRNGIPENPEAWLTRAAKNRTLDLFRQLKSEKERIPFFENGVSAIAISEMFLDNEIADSQLRMIFMACHPSLDSRDQIAFALKSIAGFSQKEIAAALLLKVDTIKKRLSRARATIQKEQLLFEIPQGKELLKRQNRVLEVLYLIFNEGFHSSKKDHLVRNELCGEAMRLCKILLEHPKIASDECHALFALMCFHAARLDSKVDDLSELKDLRLQERSKYHLPLIMVGNNMMTKAIQNGNYSHYHYEAAIAFEHISAKSFEDTNWDKILFWYKKLQEISPSPINLMNMAIVNIELKLYDNAIALLDLVEPKELQQREYLFYGCKAQYYQATNKYKEAIENYTKAISLVNNNSELKYLKNKRQTIHDFLSNES